MFTNLIESESHRGDFKRRGSFLLITTAVYALFFVFAGVLSIYAYDAQLENQDQELRILEFIPPIATPREVVNTPRNPPRSASHNVGPLKPPRLPELYENPGSPRTPPKDISTIAMAIPPAPQGAIRDPNHFGLGSGPVGSGPLGPGGTGNDRGTLVPDTGEAVPPPIKQPVPKPRTVHRTILNGQAISLPKPPYPPLARQIRIQGTVSVQVLVDETGKVISARAVSGPSALTHAAVTAAHQARFTPTMLDGQPVKVSGVITYNFILQ